MLYILHLVLQNPKLQQHLPVDHTQSSISAKVTKEHRKKDNEGEVDNVKKEVKETVGEAPAVEVKENPET